MKALLLEAPKDLKKIDAPAPEKPGPGEALVRVHRIGICGTDISGYLGKMPFFSYPRIPGHELGVEVVEVGEGVTNVRPGDRCSVEPYINDPDSYASRRGHPNCCERLEVLGVHRDGGMRPLFILPARKLHPSTKLALDQLALVETLAIGCHAVDRGAPRADESCLVIGAGPIGLATLEFVKLTGARTVVLDMNEARLDFCRRTMGVEHTIKTSDHLEKDLRDATDGHLPDVVIDATGSSASMSNAFGLIAPGGRLVYVGITTDEVRFRHPVFHRPEGTLLCSRNALPGDFTRIIGLIEDGRIDTKPWITHRAAFDELPAVFPSYTRPETGVIKAVVEIPSNE
jgi:2-desacetyl-2-hydroxyethyl bacteriochlorophyllide A dehydrogenase